MKRFRTRVSPGTGRLYPPDDDLRGLAGGALDGLRGPRRESDGPAGLKKRGPKTKLSDEELVEEIRQVLKESDFLGEGHRKVRARLRAKPPDRCGQEPRAAADAGEWAAGPGTARKAPAWGPEPQRPDHDGCAERAVGYGRDAVLHEGGSWCWFFVAVDHCVTDVVGWHVAKKGDRWAALEPIRQGVRTHMDGVRAQDRSGRPTARLGPSVHRPSVPRRAGLARDPLDGLT